MRLKTKTKKENLIITKATGEERLFARGRAYIAENGYLEAKKDLIEKPQKRMKTATRDCDMANEKTCEMNPIALKSNDLVILHKERRLILPLVNCIRSSSYRIAKIAARFLIKNLQFELVYGTRNNLELID
jgi:hypothetical protein